MDLDFTNKNPKLFYSKENFPELKILEENYKLILGELQSLLSNTGNGFWLSTFPDYVFSEKGNKWKVFTFQFFGIKHLANCRICPVTTALLSKIPNLVSADFSFLPAGTSINPHKGFTRMVLRAHLGLIVPDDCGIRVGDKTKKWIEGELLIFDDSFEHEAWNRSNHDRFVLMLDIVNPLWNYNSDQVNRYKIENLNDEFMLSMFPRERWIEFLDKGYFDLPYAL
ncbi:MAG: aspartyl/asparaginyl beta-hydroxylase domain-containing protein [Bacteroidota bacterium]